MVLRLYYFSQNLISKLLAESIFKGEWLSKGIFDPYLEELNPERWIDTFPNLMWGLGFDMDCYNSYREIYPVYPDFCLPQKEIEDIILNNLQHCDKQIVGNYIFSRYRELTHWSDYGYKPEETEYFFPKAFTLLEEKFENENN